MTTSQSGEFQRFTIDEVNVGRAVGWTLAAGWFPFGTSHWAWFRREASHG